MGIEKTLERELPAQRTEAADVAVVHEQPVPVAERVAIGLLHGGADRRPHVDHEQRGLDVRGQLAQVRVRPRRRDAVVQAGAVAAAVPAHAEPVAVGRLGAHAGVQALVDDAVLGVEQQFLHQHGLAQPRHPAAHAPGS
jgi:hypothetical protein